MKVVRLLVVAMRIAMVEAYSGSFIHACSASSDGNLTPTVTAFFSPASNRAAESANAVSPPCYDVTDSDGYAADFAGGLAIIATTIANAAGNHRETMRTRILIGQVKPVERPDLAQARRFTRNLHTAGSQVRAL